VAAMHGCTEIWQFESAHCDPIHQRQCLRALALFFGLVLKENSTSENTMKITNTSGFTGKTHTREINCTQSQLAEYMQPDSTRRLIQDIFPDISADDREFLMTGVTPEEWSAVFD